MEQFKCIEKIKDIKNGLINFILYCPNNDIIVYSCHFWIKIYSFSKNKICTKFNTFNSEINRFSFIFR